MITTNDIKNSICSQLDGSGFMVSGENITLDDDEPIIQLGVDLVTSEFIAAGLQIHKTYLIDVMWSHGLAPDNEEMNDAQEAIAAVLTPCVHVDGRNLKAENVRYNKSSGLAHVLFELDVYDSIPQECPVTMEELTIGGI